MNLKYSVQNGDGSLFIGILVHLYNVQCFEHALQAMWIWTRNFLPWSKWYNLSGSDSESESEARLEHEIICTVRVFVVKFVKDNIFPQESLEEI